MRARLLIWTADLEDDLTDPGSVRVFVPSIMGAGILVSLGILMGDLRRALAPRAGEVRRQAHLRRQALALVAPMSGAIGAPLPAVPALRRRLRSRPFYAGLFAAAVSLSLYVGIGSTFNYLRDVGLFSHKVWMESLAISVSVAFFAMAVVAAVTVLRYPVIPRWARPLIERTPLGAPEE